MREKNSANPSGRCAISNSSNTSPLGNPIATLWRRYPTSTLTRSSTDFLSDTYPLLLQNKIDASSFGLVYLQSHVFGENMAPSRSTPQMMQVTRAAFQAFASLNEQATDPKSHTLVKNSLQDSFTSCYLLNSDGRPRFPCSRLYGWDLRRRS